MGSKQLRWCLCGSPCLMSPGYGGSYPRSHTVRGFRAAGPSFCRTGLSLGSCRRGSVPGIFSGSFSTFILKQKCCSVAQSCLTLCDPMDCSTPGFPISQSLFKLMSTELMMPSNHLMLCFLLLLLPSLFPSIRVFSSESALGITRPKCWSFSFSISPSNEYSGLISFRKQKEMLKSLPNGQVLGLY